MENNKYSNISVIILAGGQSQRAETIKGLRKVGTDYWVDLQISFYKKLGIKHIFIGLGFDHEEYINHSKQIKNISYVINQNPENGSFSTLQTVLNYAIDTKWDQVILMHIDHAIPNNKTIEKLLNTTSCDVIKPTHNGQSGHPIVISHSFCCDLIRKNPSSTLNIEIKMLSLSQIKWIEVNDASIVENLNTESRWLKFQKSI